ncbi:ABC transporter permease [Legionella dresdenensis]|uniref:ABC transporter permease n=1 Tax=Legionella dresdenensis TaxID=450200 RepID=A0ABV8CF28_9GAMM
MNWIALKMLVGDRTKFLGLVFGIAFATVLIAQQGSIFIGVMKRTASFIYAIRDADIWVMDKQVDNLDIIDPLRDTALNMVRTVPGVQWAAPLLKIIAIAKPTDGVLNQATVIGLDDPSLAGAPTLLKAGNIEDLRRADAIIVDTIGYNLLWPQDHGHYKLGRTLELNDHRAVLVGVADTMPSFQFAPIIYTRYSNALNFTNGGRKRMSFILVKAQPGYSPEEVAGKIEKTTPLRALTRPQFKRSTIRYYIENTGIPVNFGVTVSLGLIVGSTIVGLLLNMFVSDNIRQFGALKAMGIANRRLMSIVLVQSLVVFAIGFSLGSGVATLFFRITGNTYALKGLYMPWFMLAITGGLIFVVTILSSMFSLRRVLRIDPAIVFKG